MTTNQQQPIRIYTPQYKENITSAVNATEAFKAFQAPVQVEDGVTHKKKAFTVKTSSTPVVIGTTYNEDKNSGGFGDASGEMSRFGKMTEVTYGDEDVDYNFVLTANEGIDRATVNQDEKQAVADRMDLNSQEQIRVKNKKLGEYLSKNATETKSIATLEADDIIKLFNEASALFTNREVRAKLHASVTPALFNALVDMITFKAISGATVDPNDNKVVNWKGFVIAEEPEQYFADGDVAYFGAETIVIPFVGIDVARTLEAINFNGLIYQSYAKGGHFISDDNKQALIKATMGKAEAKTAKAKD